MVKEDARWNRKESNWSWGEKAMEWEGEGARCAFSWFLEMPGMTTVAGVARNARSQGHVTPKRSRTEYFPS